MSKCYDIDRSGEDAKSALRAIIARIDGVWDDPDLQKFGSLGNTLDDIKLIAESVDTTPDNEESKE